MGLMGSEIAASGFPVSLIVIDSPGGKLEAMDLSNRNGAVLEKAGVLVGFHTDDGVTDSRHFLRSAAFALRVSTLLDYFDGLAPNLKYFTDCESGRCRNTKKNSVD